ncbi:uncharacterized protein RCC_10787 [Ramularia collo-cygni]|uniref:Uncharacterized protein n=1 Tax=Ramularia collo-cygni TaxID=112498 RepID=A0A2D3VMI8_9PEZI|nr:uncharacterized protein RCC_10787 [Ramularia collo-cygni]CZT25059.1 uncharacterized protein RCC_10787 [Ramularia collo-cygni]
MASSDRIQHALRIIGEAINVEPEDFLDHESWKFLGLGDLLATATASDLRDQADLDVSVDVFSLYPTVGAFKAYLSGASAADDESTDPWEGVPKPKVPLSIILQGDPSTSAIIVYLFPDGSGAGTSYRTLPPIDDSVCIVGLNSPFLRQAQSFTCSIERMAHLWMGELRKLQPKGRPFTLGGWSAGGYYAFEAAKLLISSGEKVERMIIIDSPCRLDYEALPEQVVQELTRKGLMGASKEKKAPDWLVQHFTSTVISVDQYMPTPIAREHVPTKINFIWVKEGLVSSVAESGLEVDLSVKVTKFLLEPRGNLQTEGWEKLLPGAQYHVDYITGNHFQITQPPHSDSLGRMLRKAIRS